MAASRGARRTKSQSFWARSAAGGASGARPPRSRAWTTRASRTWASIGARSPRSPVGVNSVAGAADMSVIDGARRLDRRDLPELERHLLALEPAARRARFASAFSDAAILASGRGLNPARGNHVVAVDEASGRIFEPAEEQAA